METEEMIAELVIGIFLIFLSYQVGMKGNIALLHSYHYTNLDPKDHKTFTQKIGLSNLLVSIGVIMIPAINLISKSELGYYVGVVMIFLGIFFIIFFIVTYNGKLISFKKK